LLTGKVTESPPLISLRDQIPVTSMVPYAHAQLSADFINAEHLPLIAADAAIEVK
jgi:hypothetical protein